MIHGCASMSSAGMWGLCSICREAGVPMNTQSSPCQRRAGGGDSSWTNALQRSDGCGKDEQQVHYYAY